MTEAPETRRQFFATLLAGALSTGTAVLATLGSSGRARTRENAERWDGPKTIATTSDEMLATMNDLTGILES